MIGNNSVLNPNLYSKFTDNKDLTQKREFMSYAYGNYKPQYYNDGVVLDKKKKNRLAIGILSLSGLVVAASAIFATRPGNIEKILEGAKTTKGKIQDLHILDKISNIMTSANNIKDTYWKKFTTLLKDKTPLGFIDMLGEKYSDLYRNVVQKSPLAGEYQKAYDKMIKAGGSSIKGIDNFSFEKLYNQVNSQTQEIINKTDITKGILKKDTLKKISETNILDPHLKDVYKNALTNVKIPEGTSAELSGAIKEFNAVREKTAKSLVPKMRDINAGAAPTDFINQILVPTVSLGVAVKTSDTKEEKKSTLFNLGIPIISAMTFTQIANLRMLSGLKGMVFGFATGAIITTALKFIDKAKHKINTQTETSN